MSDDDSYSDDMDAAKPGPGTDTKKLGKNDAYAKYMKLKAGVDPDKIDDDSPPDSDEDISITEDDEMEDTKQVQMGKPVAPEMGNDDDYSQDMELSQSKDILASGGNDNLQIENVEVKDPEQEKADKELKKEIEAIPKKYPDAKGKAQPKAAPKKA